MRIRSPVGGLILAGIAAGWSSVALGCSRSSEIVSALEVTPDPIDFGEVRWSDDVEKDVRIRNRATYPVTLKDPSFDCSCFALTNVPAILRLDAGQEVNVRIALRSRLAKEGPMRKTFTIRCDDPVKPKVDVPILGNILQFRTIDPARLEFGDVDPAGPPVEKTVKVRGGFGFHVKVASATSSSHNLTAEIRPAANGEDGNDVAVRTVKGAKGSLNAQILLSLEVKDDRGSPPRTSAESVFTYGEVR